MSTRVVRLLAGAVGALAAAYGGWLLLGEDGAGLVSTGLWMAGGVVLHDVVLAPLVILLGVLVTRRLVPSAARAPLVVGAVVVGVLTLVAVPVLGRFGRSPGNETLLDRDYGAGWLLVTGITLAVVLVATVLSARSRSRRSGER